jgi:hypothetical protein
MANTDVFSAQIVEFVRRMPSAQIVELVRRMPDETILALVKDQLGAVAGAAAIALPRRRGRPPGRPAGPARAAAAGRGRGKARRGRPGRRPGGSAERQQLLNAVEKIVKGSSGMSASEVAKSAGVPQTRAAAALKDLKITKRIFQGGDRRFARYAGDARAAEQASLQARKSAAGPVAKKKGRKAAK